VVTGTLGEHYFPRWTREANQCCHLTQPG